MINSVITLPLLNCKYYYWLPLKLYKLPAVNEHSVVLAGLTGVHEGK